MTTTRRTALRGGLVAGAALFVAAPLRALADQAVAALPSSASRAALASAVACTTLTPEETQGPFWVDERLNRSDVRPDSETGAVQAGIPLTLTINLQDAGASCTPQANAAVDIWHANAQGAYSDVSGSGNPNNLGVDWLRGYQVSDANGSVTFTTIMPGWYVSRTIHIHFRIRTSSGINFTSQLYFDESVATGYVSTPNYTKSGTRTTNGTDQLYDGALLVPLTGSNADGYAGTFTVNLDFNDGTSTDSSVSARVTSARVRRSGGRRVVIVQTQGSEPIAALVRLVRSDNVMALKRTGWLAKGGNTVRLRVPRKLKPGPAKVVVLLADAAGNTKVQRLNVRIPKR